MTDRLNAVATPGAELSNHDNRRAAPTDAETMAGCDPGPAIWTATNRAGAHDVLQAPNGPAQGPRVEKTDSENVRPLDVSIATLGSTDVSRVQTPRDELNHPQSRT